MGKTQRTKKIDSPELTRPIGLKVEYSDLVRVASGPDGILLSFCQSTPMKNEVVITNDMLLPLRVARSLHSILGAQLDIIDEQNSKRENE